MLEMPAGGIDHVGGTGATGADRPARRQHEMLYDELAAAVEQIGKA